VLIFNTLAPVFLVIALGAALQRVGFISSTFLKEANRLIYWVGLPALLFVQLAGTPPSIHAAAPLLTVLSGTVVVIGLAYATAYFLRLPGPVQGTFVQGSFRGNLAFAGLPIVFSLPDTPLAGGLTVRSTAVIVVAPAMVLYNLMGVGVLLLSQHSWGPAMFKPLLRQLVTTPPLLATLAGLGFAAAGLHLPSAVARALGGLGEMALPLGLLAVGGSLMALKPGHDWRASGLAVLIKTVLSPAIGWAIGRWWGLEPAALQVVMILMACPTAIVSYTMVLELKGDEAMASSVIVGTVCGSLVTLALIGGLF
jgi:predicted permease